MTDTERLDFLADWGFIVSNYDEDGNEFELFPEFETADRAGLRNAIDKIAKRMSEHKRNK